MELAVTPTSVAPPCSPLPGAAGVAPGADPPLVAGSLAALRAGALACPGWPDDAAAGLGPLGLVLGLMPAVWEPDPAAAEDAPALAGASGEAALPASGATAAWSVGAGDDCPEASPGTGSRKPAGLPAL